MAPRQTALWLRAAFFAAALVMAACQTAPVQEMSDARQAISVAKDAGAAEHAKAELDAAVGYLESAERFLSEHDYARARRDALAAKENALQALRLTESVKQEPQ